MKTKTSPSQEVTYILGTPDTDSYEIQRRIQHAIDSSIEADSFRGAYFVVMYEYDHPLSYSKSLRDALHVLKRDPQATVIIWSGFSKLYTLDSKPELEVIMQYPNAYLLTSDIEDLEEAVQNAFSYGERYIGNKDFGMVFVAEKYLDHINRLLENDWDNFENKVGDVVREVFPAFRGASTEELRAFIKHAITLQELPMAGMYKKGVYFDVEGTLVVDEKPNTTNINKFREHEKNGDHVHVWSGGPKDKRDRLQEKLLSFGIQYTLENKLDYSGATVELAYDDQDIVSFAAQAKIDFERYIQV